MPQDPDSLYKRALETLDEGGWSRLLKGGFGTIFLSWVFSVTGIMGSFFERLFGPFGRIMAAVGTYIDATAGAGARVINAGGQASANSFLEGIGSFFGPAALPASVFVVALSLIVLDWWWERVDYSPIEHITNLFSRGN
ncbi:hypothetical protein [Halopiger thermotolerans]